MRRVASFLCWFLGPSVVVSLVTSSDAIYLISGNGIRDRSTLNNHLTDLQTELSHDIEVLRIYDNLATPNIPHLPHYAARLSTIGLHLLQRRSDISFVEQDQLISLDECITQDNPDWGLSRINQRGSFKLGTYAYETQVAGAGINIYVIGPLPPLPFLSLSCELTMRTLRHRDLLRA
jgi:hypothetical protein